MKHALLTLVTFLALVVNAVYAEEKKIIPDHEYKKAKSLKMAGPTKTHGIGSSELLGTIALAGDFPSMKGYVMRTRRITLNPGGEVAVHEHHTRPGVAYVLEGDLIEHRNDVKSPQHHTKGDTSFEKSGVAHWWENKSDKPGTVIVVDIVPEGTK